MVFKFPEYYDYEKIEIELDKDLEEDIVEWRRGGFPPLDEDVRLFITGAWFADEAKSK